MRTSRILALAAAAVLVVGTAARAQQRPEVPAEHDLPQRGGLCARGDPPRRERRRHRPGVVPEHGMRREPVHGVFSSILGYFETSGENGLQVSAFPGSSLPQARPANLLHRALRPRRGRCLLHAGGAEGPRPLRRRLQHRSSPRTRPAASTSTSGTFRSVGGARYVWLDASGLDLDGLADHGKDRHPILKRHAGAERRHPLHYWCGGLRRPPRRQAGERPSVLSTRRGCSWSEPCIDKPLRRNRAFSRHERNRPRVLHPRERRLEP